MLTVNDKSVEYKKGMTVTGVIKACNFTFPLLIVKIEGNYVPRDRYNDTKVKDGQTLEIIHLISGG